LHIVQDQQHWTADGQQRPCQALEEAVALPSVGHRPGSGAALSAAPGRHQPVDFNAPRRVNRRCRRLDGRISHPVSHRCQRQPPRRSEALGIGHNCALQPRQICYLGHQAGLADTGAAADQRETGATCCGGAPQLLEQTEFGRPADELC